MAQPPCKTGPSGELVCPDTSVHASDADYCLDEIKFDQSDMPQWCDGFKAAADSQFFLMGISLQVWGPAQSMYDSAHMVWLRDTSEAMFTKYELFTWPDTVRSNWSSQRNAEYNYHMIIMTKATALALRDESYVHSLWGERPAQTGLNRSFSRGNIPWSRKVSGIGFDALGKSRNIPSGSGLKIFSTRKE
jgi:hypothetical protein